MAWRNVLGPHAFVASPALDRGAWVSAMTIYQADCAHQVVEVQVMQVYPRAAPSQEWRTPSGPAWREGYPVHLRYGYWADDSADWYGYVASSRVLSQPSQPAYGHAVVIPVVYTLVGTSMGMQSHRERLWRDSTASGIAREIALDHQLRPRVDLTSIRFDARMQAASDWHFLAELADRVGYRVYVDGVTLWFVDRSTAIPAADGSVPQFWARQEPGLVDSLRDFSAVVGDTDPAGGLRPHLSTISLGRESGVLVESSYYTPRGEPSLGSTPVPTLRRRYGDIAARSWAEGEELVAADAEYLWVEARADVNGDPRLKPGSLVDLRGDSISPAHAGPWLVRSAVHKLTLNQFVPAHSAYVAELVLGRNRAETLSLPTQAPAPDVPRVVLVDGRWRAEYAGAA